LSSDSVASAPRRPAVTVVDCTTGAGRGITARSRAQRLPRKSFAAVADAAGGVSVPGWASAAAGRATRIAAGTGRGPLVMVGLLVAEQLGEARVLSAELGLELRRLAKLGPRLGQLAEAIVRERRVQPDAAIARIGFLGDAIGLERALEVAAGE